jgi:hypothetical protein
MLYKKTTNDKLLLASRLVYFFKNKNLHISAWIFIYNFDKAME